MTCRQAAPLAQAAAPSSPAGSHTAWSRARGLTDRVHHLLRQQETRRPLPGGGQRRTDSIIFPILPRAANGLPPPPPCAGRTPRSPDTAKALLTLSDTSAWLHTYASPQRRSEESHLPVALVPAEQGIRPHACVPPRRRRPLFPAFMTAPHAVSRLSHTQPLSTNTARLHTPHLTSAWLSCARLQLPVWVPQEHSVWDVITACGCWQGYWQGWTASCPFPASSQSRG